VNSANERLARLAQDAVQMTLRLSVFFDSTI
jgi:hypothetical protein